MFVLPVSVLADTALSAETKPVIDVTYNSAQISADITAGDTPDNVYWFEWGISGNLGDTVFKSPVRTVGTRYTRTGTYTLRGLAPSTQYFYRVVAENQTDHVAGRTIYFTTKSYETASEAIVIAKTYGTTSDKDTGATLHGYVAPHTAAARYWFEWGTDVKLGQVTSDHAANRDGGEVTIELHGLVPGTTYYYRIAAENERGIVRGAILSFKTTGTKPVEEVKKDQTNATPGSSKVNSSTSANTGTNSTSATNNTQSTIPASALTGSVGSTQPGVNIAVSAIGKAGVHETIEYKFTYAYNRSESGKKARFEVIMPATLAYLGDTTAKELRVEELQDGTRRYILSIGTIKRGDARTFSIITMTTADAKGIPAVKANLIFTNNANEQLVAGVAAARGGTSPIGTSSSGTFPTTMILWLVVLNVAVGSILGMVRAKEWYKETKARLKSEEEKAAQAAVKIKNDLAEGHLMPATVVVPENPPQVERPVIRRFEQELDAVRGEGVEEFGLPGAYTVAA